MKNREIFGFILFGFLLHHIEDMIELGKAIVASNHAESSAIQKLRIEKTLSNFDNNSTTMGFCTDETSE